MIYAFIKENNEYINKDEQEKIIEQFASDNGLIIDRYLTDNYSHKYSRILLLKNSRGTGSYIFNLNSGDVVICANFYTLAYTYKTILFLIKTALERGATVYSAEGKKKLTTNDLAAINAIYDLLCFFDNKRTSKTLERHWTAPLKSKLDIFRPEIKSLLQQGASVRVITSKYSSTYTTVMRFLKNNPELFAIYKKKYGNFLQRSNRKLTEKRPLLKTQINRYIRKVKADIVQTPVLQLAKKLDTLHKNPEAEKIKRFSLSYIDPKLCTTED